MAHFFAPDQSTCDYDVDGRLAPGSVSRMRIPTGQRRTICLWGGQGLTVRSNNPCVLPNDGFGENMSRPDGVRRFSLLGQVPGTARLEVSQSGNLWISLQVDVGSAALTSYDGGKGSVAKDAEYLPRYPGNAAAAVILAMGPSNLFTMGFIEGLSAQMNSLNVDIVITKIKASPVDFYANYVKGVFVGFYEGAKGLVEALIGLFKLAIALSPSGITYVAIRLVTDRDYRALRVMEAKRAKAAAEAVIDVMGEFFRTPLLYIAKSYGAGKVLGETLAQEINAGVASKSASQIGGFIGEIVGRVLFEVILIVVTEGIGEGARGAAAAGEGGGAIARIAARVADKLRDSLEGLPALRRAFVKIFG